MTYRFTRASSPFPPLHLEYAPGPLKLQTFARDGRWTTTSAWHRFDSFVNPAIVMTSTNLGGYNGPRTPRSGADHRPHACHSTSAETGRQTCGQEEEEGRKEGRTEEEGQES